MQICWSRPKYHQHIPLDLHRQVVVYHGDVVVDHVHNYVRQEVASKVDLEKIYL